MRIAIHAANQHVFIVTKTILATFIHCRNHKELWTRLTELYEPLLFRSLSATNSLVRRHAVIIFTDCFPLGTSDTRDSYSIEEQFKALLVNTCIFFLNRFYVMMNVLLFVVLLLLVFFISFVITMNFYLSQLLQLFLIISHNI